MINFRIYPNIKKINLILKKKEKLTLGRFFISFKKYLNEKKYINKYNKPNLIIKFNKLEITPKLMKKNFYTKVKNAYKKSINKKKS